MERTGEPDAESVIEILVNAETNEREKILGYIKEKAKNSSKTRARATYRDVVRDWENN